MMGDWKCEVSLRSGEEVVDRVDRQRTRGCVSWVDSNQQSNCGIIKEVPTEQSDGESSPVLPDKSSWCLSEVPAAQMFAIWRTARTNWPPWVLWLQWDCECEVGQLARWTLWWTSNQTASMSSGAGWFHCEAATNDLWKVMTDGCNKAHLWLGGARWEIHGTTCQSPSPQPLEYGLCHCGLLKSFSLSFLTVSSEMDKAILTIFFHSDILHVPAAFLTFFFWWLSWRPTSWFTRQVQLAVKPVFCSRHSFFLSMTLTCLPSNTVLQTNVCCLTVDFSLVTDSSSSETPF